jgi:hypothetical protein
MTPLKEVAQDMRLKFLQHEVEKLQRLVDHNLANWEEMRQLHQYKRELVALEDRCQHSVGA